MKSRFYSNVRYLCSKRGVRMREIEEDVQAGYLSRRADNWESVRLGVAYHASKLLGVSINDLIEKSFAIEEERHDLKCEIERLTKRLNALKGGERDD